jgi:hypothetical protein
MHCTWFFCDCLSSGLTLVVLLLLTAVLPLLWCLAAAAVWQCVAAAARAHCD